MGIAVLYDYLYVIGGCSTDGCLDLVEYYDPDDDAWEEADSMNVRRANPGVGVLDNKIYVLGGENNNGDYLQSVEVYDQSNGIWTVVGIKIKKHIWLKQFDVMFSTFSSVRLQR